MDGDTIMYWWQGKRDGLFSRAPTALVLQKNHRVEGGELRGVFVSVSTFRRHGAAAGTFFDPGSPQNSGSAIDGNVHSVRVQVSIALHRYLPFAAEPAAAALRPALTVTVTIVPDSGTGELAGISGTLEIDNVEEKYSYVLEYEHR